MNETGMNLPLKTGMLLDGGGHKDLPNDTERQRHVLYHIDTAVVENTRKRCCCTHCKVKERWRGITYLGMWN
jgi:hypothetical protein